MILDPFLYFLADNWHAQEETDFIILDFREDFPSDDLFDDQRNGYDQGRLYLIKGLGDDRRTGQACQEEDMDALQEFKQKFEGHPVHVGHRKDTYRLAPLFDPVT